MIPDEKNLKNVICNEACAQGIDLTQPGNSFIVAKLTPQGTLLRTFKDYMSAESYAKSLWKAGNTEIYVMSAADQHGLMKIVAGELKFVS